MLRTHSCNHLLEGLESPIIIEFISTADLADGIGPDVRSCDTQVRNLGGHLEPCDKISTIKCLQDNALLKKTLSESSEGGVLIINGDVSVHTVLVGNVIVGLGKDDGWAGVVVNGVTRDSRLIGEIDFDYKAFDTNPHKFTRTGEGKRDVVVFFGGIDFIPGETLYTDPDDIVAR